MWTLNGGLEWFVMYKYKFKYEKEKKCMIVLGYKHSKDADFRLLIWIC